MPRKPKNPKPLDPDVDVFSLYDGQVRLEYKDSSHRYKVSDNEAKPEQVPSVTTILNVLNKPALVEWATRVVCDRVEQDIRALVAGSSFSVDQIFKVIAAARTAHHELREEAAEIGVNTHDWLSQYWKGYLSGVCPPMPEDPKVQNCINAALDWFQTKNIKPLFVEQPQYSRIHKISGRSDLIAEVDGQLSVVDYKSTRSLYPECAIQMAAYAKFHEEQHQALPAVRWGLRLNKEDGTFEARRYPPETLDLDFSSFMACYTIYDRMKHLRRKEKPEADSWLG